MKSVAARGRSRVLFMITLTAIGAASGCGTTAPNIKRNEIPASVPEVPAGAELATARAAFESGNFGYAARYFEMVAQDAPENMEACLGMAASYDWLYRFDLADRAYRDCKKIDADNFLYLNNIGFSYLLRGEYGKASVSFAQAETIRPGDPVTATNMRILRDATSG